MKTDTRFGRCRYCLNDLCLQDGLVVEHARNGGGLVKGSIRCIGGGSQPQVLRPQPGDTVYVTTTNGGAITATLEHWAGPTYPIWLIDNGHRFIIGGERVKEVTVQ
jgi:hypothetical protein